jgi:glycosyltransferase involved in cell wall biosynthesis
MNKIQLCMIIKNGADTIHDTLNSYTKYVSRMIILDTGSTDNTLEILENFKSIYPQLIVYKSPFKGFSESRNQCLDLAYDLNYTWTLMIDDSYQLLTNFNELQNVPDKVDAISIVVTKTDNVQNLSNRIIRTSSKLRYIGDIHEYINSNLTYPVKSIRLLDVVTPKQQSRTYERNKNDLKILQGKTDSRSLYYTACTLNNQYIQGLIKWNVVVNAFMKRLEKDDYPEERFVSMIHIANLLHINDDDKLESHKFYLKAAIEYKPRAGEAYFYLYLSSNSPYWLEMAYKNRKVGKCMMSYDPTVYEVLIPNCYAELSNYQLL